MTTPIWKLLPVTLLQPTQVVYRTWSDGHQESCLVTTPEYLKWLEEGNTPLPAGEE
jgi:hypothetical protein